MGQLHERLSQDLRFIEGLKACMNCGVCTAICPAAEFYHYDPRIICDTVQTGDDELIEQLLRSETIWYCGECMSCATRCPRGNTPGLLIMSLRKLSQDLGYFTDSEKGRQQFAIKRVIGNSILTTGYCVHPNLVSPENHPEQGPVWEWIYNNLPEVMDKVGANYRKEGPGAMRKISPDVLTELAEIFEVTGANDFFQVIEQFSKEKAIAMSLNAGEEGSDNAYFSEVYSTNKGNHN
jgi:heterodisulfide reductase subunit C1